MRVLIAEDQPVERLLVQSAVEHLGHACWATSDGTQAWQVFQQEHPDVVISDWRMPGLDGPALCQRVRACDGAAYTPFIFLTGLSDRGHALAAMEAGADDFLIKPLDVDDLRARLRAAERLKRVEEARQALLEQERTARQAVEEALRQRDEVLAAVSHDLRSPITAIRATAQVLQRLASRRADEVPQRDPRIALGAQDRVGEMLDRIVAAATRMDHWIDDLIDVTHLRAGQPLSLQLEPTDLVDLAQAAITEHQAASSRHMLRLEATPPRLVALADSARLRRVLDNLLSNALKYSPDGGTITVTLSRAAEAGDAWAVLCVRDEGIGIPAADLPHVFAWARRASNARRIAGQGLGLAGAQRIIEQHGGTLTVQSHEGQGSAFTIRLPLPADRGAACAS